MDPRTLQLTYYRGIGSGFHCAALTSTPLPPVRSLSHLTLLEKLDLGANDFCSVSAVVGSLESLTELWLDANTLGTLPEVRGCEGVRGEGVRLLSQGGLVGLFDNNDLSVCVCVRVLAVEWPLVAAGLDGLTVNTSKY